MMVITSDRHKEEDRLRWRVSSNCFCQCGSKSKQKSSMSQKMGRMSMKRTPCRSRDEVLVNYILQLGVLFSISYVELTFPYKRRYYLLCEICSRGVELKGRQIDAARKLNGATSALLA